MELTINRETIRYEQMHDIVEQVQRNAWMKLTFRWCHIAEDAIVLLSNAIQNKRISLKCLHFHYSNLEDTDIRTLVRAISDNQVLTSVHFSHEENQHDVWAGPYRARGRSVSQDVLQTIHTLLQNNTQLISVVYPYLHPQYGQSSPEQDAVHEAIQLELKSNQFIADLQANACHVYTLMLIHHLTEESKGLGLLPPELIFMLFHFAEFSAWPNQPDYPNPGFRALVRQKADKVNLFFSLPSCEDNKAVQSQGLPFAIS